ncbi:two component transcriptional regulator, LytTR family [Pedobacter suwonensis]|uniref:Two component transcriptional regulator, LytTR family n=1 Tax=Pedobacter suwonensis TaxID=332999 RepID=A0A1I0TQT2_9SPHI|nr:LytTR family DNA-binding domain-containing protein [Pedobacter suwonensis]SFA54124.1 two component transcriptional regulator, LytTR family [Pedobacter suwonensis]
MYRCVIIDDEPHAIEGLKSYFLKMPALELVATYTDPVKALKEITDEERLDLILLDIDMPEISGIELAKIIRNNTERLIFTTAHTKYGFEAFEVRANDYLLKPFSLAKFMDVIQRLFSFKNEIFSFEQGNQKDVQQDFFFVKSSDDNLRLVKVRFKDVVSAESKSNYVQLHTISGKRILTYMSLSEMSKNLGSERGFIQFQRSFILNRNLIDSIDGNVVTMDGGQKVTIGDYYRKHFHKFVDDHLIKAKRKV